MKAWYLLGLLGVLAGCEPASSPQTAPAPLLQGELTAERLVAIVTPQLARANSLMADSALTEAQLDQQISVFSQLLGMAEQLGGDKSRLYHAELLSGFGALHARKAAFYKDKAQQAGSYSAKGYRYLDRAISQYPDNITARINRGLVSAKMPEFMHKTDVAVADLTLVVQSKEFASFSPGLQQQLQQTLADLQQRQQRLEHE
jgi:hypothetical protein